MVKFRYHRAFLGILTVAGLWVCLLALPVSAAGPYPYYGGPSNPPPDNSSPDNAAPANPPPENTQPAYQPPVVVQPVPVYGSPRYVRPWYAYPAAPTGAALGPWKWNFDIGGGPTPVVGGARNQLTNGWNFVVGTGYNFSPQTGWVLEFMNSGLGLTNSELQENEATDGDGRVWSVTLNPIWRYQIGGIVGGYLIAGGGFYERILDFSRPGVAFVPVFPGGGYLVPTDGLIGQEVDDTGGINIGTGLTFNLGAGTKFFAEVRYHYIFTSGGATQLLPITFGFRW